MEILEGAGAAVGEAVAGALEVKEVGEEAQG